MKDYIAFLRGINISGKNSIAMKDLQAAMENLGYENVSTYLNSGNVAFSSPQDNPRSRIESMLEERFSLSVPTYVLERERLADILAHAPSWWDSGDKALYDNLIFILSADSPAEIRGLIGNPSDGLEQVAIYEDVIFWTFDRARYQKCHWWKKTASAGIAEHLTIRTAGTVKKLLR